MVFSRKNLAMLKEIYIGKIFYYLNQKVVYNLKTNKINIPKLRKLILDIYKTLATKEVYDSAEKSLNSLTDDKFKDRMLSGNMVLYIVVPPFSDVSFENIKKAANILDIPLEEHIFIPELGAFSTEKCPVGVSYYQFLEHHSDVYSSIRGSEKYQSLSGQPTRGKSRGGGQSIGNLDVYALLTQDTTSVLKELMGPRSDQHAAKRIMYNNIIENGETDLPETGYSTGGTHDLFKIYMIGLGLNVEE